ncbi:MAG: heparinase II/III family protein, partial [Pirellulales bacterium]
MTRLHVDFVAALLVMFAIGVASASAQVDLPPADRLLGTLAPDHPRLLVSAAGFARIRAGIEKHESPLGRWYQAIHRQADEILAQPVSLYEIPDGLRLLSTSRRVVSRTYTLALVYRMTGERKYRDRAWRELETAAGFPDWNDKKHFLDTAEMTHALAIGYDWLYDQWSDAERTILRDAIVQMGLRPAMAVYENKSTHWGWHRSHHNWNQVCNGGVSLGALAVAEVEPKLAARVLHQAAQSITIAMEQFAPDGACVEGPGYWHYATSYNVYYLAALESALGTDFGFTTMPGFSKTGDFPVYLTGPFGKTFNFADAGDGRIRAPQLFWLAQRFHEPRWAEYQREYAAPTVHDIIWYVSPDALRTTDKRPLDKSLSENDAGSVRRSGGVTSEQDSRARSKYFRGAEVVTMRSGWDDPDALFVGVMAGDNGVNHSNLDLGSFVFDALGQRWVLDLGADNYNLPGYFDPKAKRWNYYRMRAESHNTLVFNPDGQPDQAIDGKCAIVRFDANRDRPFAIADLTGAYRRHAKSV